jgi:hypothetical protein
MRLTGSAGTLTTVAATVLIALGAADAARADFSSGEYSHAGGGCASRVDPITLVIYGYTAYYEQARAVVESKTGWSGDNSASQYGTSHGFCTPMDGESYSRSGLYERQHLRYNQTHHRDLKNRYETVGTPHYEIVRSCGHVTTTYVYTRNWIVGRMSPPYATSYQYWGNTQNMYQCDGYPVSSDGQVAWVNIV